VRTEVAARTDKDGKESRQVMSGSLPTISTVTHVMSVDVEDYFQVEAFAETVSVDSWDTRPSRVVANTQRALDLLDRHGARATFFFVGWVAQRFRELFAKWCREATKLLVTATGTARFTSCRRTNSAKTHAWQKM